MPFDATPREVPDDGPRLYVIWPISETRCSLYGPTFTCNRWQDGHLTDCRINGRRVSERTYRARLAALQGGG